MNRMVLTTLLLALFYNSLSESTYTISGRVIDEATGKPMQNATVHLKGRNYSTVSNADGSFRLHTSRWYDSLEITNISFETFTIVLQKGNISNLTARIKNKVNALQEVVVGVSKNSGKSFMERVIEHKANNNPSRFRSYSYQEYTRHELDIDRIDFEKAKGRGLRSLMLKTYAGIDSNAKDAKELPIYFAERLANNYLSR